MKKQIAFLALVSLSSVMLAGCKKDDASASGASDKPIAEAFSFVYKTKYSVDVDDAHKSNPTFQKFIHELDITTTGDVVTKSGDMYVKISQTGTDKEGTAKTLKNVKKEGLVYKDGSTYKALTTNDTAATNLTDENAAYSKIKELVSTLTLQTAGGLDIDYSFNFGKDKSEDYQYKQFHANVDLTDEEHEVPFENVTKTNGKDKITYSYEPKSIGFKTDQGYSGFGKNDSGDAPSIKYETTLDNKILSFEQKFNQKQVMPIMNPSPEVYVTGTRSLTVTHDATITKATTIDHADPADKATLKLNAVEATKGSYEVKVLADPSKPNAMTEIKDGDDLVVGQYLAVKPTAAENYEIDAVKVNNKTTTQIFGGWYCFAIVAGENAVTVTFKDLVTRLTYNGTLARVDAYKKTGDADSETLNPVYFEQELNIGDTVYLEVTAATGNTVSTVKNGATVLTSPSTIDSKSVYETTIVKGINEIHVEVTGTAKAKAKFSVTLDANHTLDTNTTYKTFLFNGSPSNYQDLADNDEVEIQSSLFGAVRTNVEKTKVEVNGVTTSVNIPDPADATFTYYCFSIKSPITYYVSVSVVA